MLSQGRQRIAAVCASGETVESRESPTGRNAKNRAPETYAYVGRYAVQLSIRGLYQAAPGAVFIRSSIDVMEHGIGAAGGDFEYHSRPCGAPCVGAAIEVSVAGLDQREGAVRPVGACEVVQQLCSTVTVPEEVILKMTPLLLVPPAAVSP